MAIWNYRVYISENIKDINDTGPQACKDLADAIKPQILNILYDLKLKGNKYKKHYSLMEDCYLDFCFISDYCLIEDPQEYGVQEWAHLFNYLFLKFKDVADMKMDFIGLRRFIWLI